MSEELDTHIKISADASGVETGITRAKRSLASLSQSADQAGEQSGRGLSKVAAGSAAVGQNMDRVTRTIADHLRRQTAAFDAGGTATRQYQESLARFRGADMNALRPLLDQFEAAKDRADQARAATDTWTSSLTRLTPLLGSLFAGVSFAGFGSKLMAVQREFDVLNASLVSVAGGSAAAEREMEWLKTFASETPFGLAQATQAFVKMKALGLDPTLATLTSFGNTASAMGKDLSQMVEAVADASTSEFERLKEFGIKAKQEGDRVSLTFQGVTKTIGNNSREIVQYLEAIGNTQFAGAMELRAKTLDGAIAAMGDSWDEFFRKVNNVTGASEAMRTSVVAVASAVDGLGDALSSNRATIDAVLGALAGAGVAAGLAALPRAISAVSTALVGLAAIAAANPVALAVLGVGAMAGGGISALRSYSRTESGIRDAIQTLQQQNAQSEQALQRALEGGRAAGADNIRKTIEGRAESVKALNRELRELQSKNVAPIAADAFGLSMPVAQSAGGAGPSKKDVDAANRELAEQAKLIAELNGLSGTFYEDWNRLSTMFGKGMFGKGAQGLEQLTRAQADLLAKQPAIKAAADDAAKLAKAEADAAAQAAKSYADTIEARQNSVASIQQQIQREKDVAAAIGLTLSQVAALEVAKLEEAAASKERLAAVADEVDLSGLLAKSYRDEAKALRDLAAAKRTTATKQQAQEATQAAIDGAKRASDEWQRYAEDINRSLTDALLRGFEAGKGFAENLRDTVENMFKTLVLRPVISAVMSPVASAIAGATGQGGSNALAMVNSGQSIWSAFSGSLTGSIGTSIASAGTMFGSSAATAFGSGFAAGGNLGLVSGFGQGSALLGSGAAGSVSSGLGTMAGAVAPYAAAALALYSIIKSFDDSGTLHSGAKAQYSAAGGLELGQHHPQYGINIGMVAGTEATQKVVADISKNLVGVFDGLSKAFGGTGGYEVATGFADDTSKDGAWGALRVSQNGKEVLNWDDTQRSRWAPKVFADGEKGYKEYLEAIAKDTKTVLSGMDLPGWAQRMVDTLGSAPGMDDLAVGVQQIEAGARVLDNIGTRIESFASYADSAVDGLVTMAGGIEALTTTLSGYYENYYSEIEKSAAKTADVSRAIAALGLTMPSLAQGANAARAQYRALVDSIDVGTEQGQRQYLGLLNLQGAFAELTPLVDQSAEAARAAAAALQQRQQLEGQLLQLQGNTVEIRLRQLAELANDENRAIQQAIYDLQDSQAAEQAAERVKAAWQSVGNTLVDEVARIRGDMAGGTLFGGFAEAQSRFALATAQARAGDQDAASSLPELSRTVLELARESAASSVELTGYQAQIAASLEETVRALGTSRGITVPAFADGGTHAGGWAMVGERGPELAYMPPSRIYPASQTTGMLGNVGELVSEMRALREDNRRLTADLARVQLRIAKAAERSAGVAEQWDADGLPAERQVVV